MDIVSSLIAGLLIAVATAVVTVWLALRRFYKEQWWSRQAQAYVEILTALFKVKTYARTRVPENITAIALTSDGENRLLERSREGFDELLRATAVNVLFLPPKARTIIEGVLGHVENSWLPDSYEQTDVALAAIETCIKELQEIAARDLRGR